MANQLIGFGEVTTPPEPVLTSGQLATTMVVRASVGSLIGAAVAPSGNEGVWAAVGFVSGALLGEMGVVGVALASLWRKAG